MREQRQKLWQQWRRLEKRIRAKDELYDVSMLRGYHCKNDGYGELLPCFSKQLAEVLNINRSHKVVDVGSGIGFLCFDLACLTGCSVKGIEIRRDIYLKSVQIAKHVTERMTLDVSFAYGDGTADTIPFKNVDILVCCNTLWSGENNYRLLQKLCLQMRAGTRVVVLEQLGGQRFHEKSPRQQNDILSSCFHVPPQKFMSDPESVSWTSNPIPFYVYTKKAITREMKDRLERDRGSVLKTPKHRTDPHVAEMAGRKRRTVPSDGGDEDDEELKPFIAQKRTKREEMKRRKKMEESDVEDSEMDSGEDDKPTVRVTRSAKLASVAKSSSTTKRKKSEKDNEKEKENGKNEISENAKKEAARKRRRAAGVITSRIRRRTRAAIVKRQQLQQQKQAKQEEDDDDEEEEDEQQDEPRKTRSQTKSSPSSSSSPSHPTLRSQVLPTTQFSELPPTTRPTKNNNNNNNKQNFAKSTKPASEKGSKPARRRPAVITAVNGIKVSERRSQRYKKFNMNLNDFIA